VIAWVLAVVHTLGAGSDRARPWLQVIVVVPLVAVVYLIVVHLGSTRRVATKVDEQSAGRDVHVALREHENCAHARACA
jgi:hypothetical protein